MPNGSRTPCTISIGTVTASSSPRRLGAGLERRGGCSGNARHSTATAPLAAAVRHATRAPDERPPATSGSLPNTLGAELVDDVDPGGVELVRRGWAAPAGDSVGLLDQRDAESFRERRVGGGYEIARGDAATGAVTQDERASWLWRRLQVGVCPAVSRLDRERFHGAA